ncbi:hypothetical protein F0L16_02070 [Photorhabdus heterorhabditis]|uniref:Uncharacterized protein n=1 Tax=Photorhabdus heterorhabditis TaxID=880156 RepID=A0A5B0X8C2_9GAMM|nr:hypothetical protein F0L16_02070 [Photorhabdus heterorhabditis]
MIATLTSGQLPVFSLRATSKGFEPDSARISRSQQLVQVDIPLSIPCYWSLIKQNSMSKLREHIPYGFQDASRRQGSESPGA